jgi:hypothetical protein
MTIIETEQSTETKFAEIIRGPFILRFSSYRKSEDAELNLRSEDYIVSELNPEKATFALCDGVGSSFYGNIGSQIVGEILRDWLNRISLPNNLMLGKNESANQWLETLSRDLHNELNQKTSFATAIIQKKEINDKDELTRLAQVTQRDDFGTQSNFACGILWPRSSALPNGLILLFWLGNARLRIFNKTTDLTHLLGWGNNPDQLREVWSSKEGVLGHIYSHMTDFSTITTVIAYSDGMENAEDKIRPNLNGAQLEALVNRSQSIKDDDVTYLELSFIEGEVAGIADDIVGLLRKPAASTSIAHNLSSSKSQPNQDTPPKKNDGPSPVSTMNPLLLFAFVSFLSILCFSLGFVTGPVVTSILRPSSTPTSTPTLKPSPTETSSITLSPSETPTSTETLTATLTLTETATITPTPTNSVTPTFSLTPISLPTQIPPITGSPGP